MIQEGFWSGEEVPVVVYYYVSVWWRRGSGVGRRCWWRQLIGTTPYSTIRHSPLGSFIVLLLKILWKLKKCNVNYAIYMNGILASVAYSKPSGAELFFIEVRSRAFFCWSPELSFGSSLEPSFFCWSPKPSFFGWSPHSLAGCIVWAWPVHVTNPHHLQYTAWPGLRIFIKKNNCLFVRNPRP